MSLLRKPEWLRIELKNNKNKTDVEKILSEKSLNTVCKEANCPNLMECYSNKTATFMILGNICTRNCPFCKVSKGNPEAIDENEPIRVAQATMEMGLKHVVITSVTRDDLQDGGAKHFAKTIKETRKLMAATIIEVLVPDFNGNFNDLDLVIEAKPQIINYNIETVRRLYQQIKPKADYNRSLEIINYIKKNNQDIYTKSGLMVGLGENEWEVRETMAELHKNKCELLTVGQYLQPSKTHYPVKEYITPAQFEKYKQLGDKMGFLNVESGPLVRSSYMAEKSMMNSMVNSGDDNL